jgi:acetyl-CoA synthetase
VGNESADINVAVAWRPGPEHVARSRLRRFIESSGCSSLRELRQRAVADVSWFWDAVVRDLGLEFFTPYERVLDLSEGAPWAHWFSGGRYNYVHNALDRHALGNDGQRPAIIWEGEDGVVRQLSYAALLEETDRVAHGLRKLAVGPGDRVGIFLPMIPEVVPATLACGKIGAIFTPIFSGYAAPAVASRLNDCRAKVVIAADGFYRRGAVVPMGRTALEAARQAPSVERVVIVDRVGEPIADGPVVSYADLASDEAGPYPTARTSASDPYMIIYTSGTTGRPKGAVHLHAGFPIKATQDLAHCFDLQADDTLFWLTDLGWMMGPWAIAGGLTLGATLCLYEGAIDFPAPDRLWRVVERHRATLLGVSPTAMRSLMARGDEWVQGRDLSCLRAFGSTGEPWNPDPWWWLFRTVGGERCPIINYSGGTEISGGIVGGFTIAPLKPCAFAGPVPGIDADVVDDQGQSVRGAVGELVIRQPWVGMTSGFWEDPARYLETYWSRFPDTWVHGDWARIDEDDAWYILGRSDDTIKLAGKRVGPAEVESAAVSHPAVVEAVAIGVPHDVKGESLVVLVVLRPDREPSEALRVEIGAAITHQLGRALRPDVVRFTAELPRTRNGKILRRIVRGAHLGRSDLGDLSALENPTAVEAVRQAR